MGKRDERYRTEFRLKRDHRSIENRAGGTHPGAEQGAMSGSLMMGMVPGMFDRLRLGQCADGKDAEHQEYRHEFEGGVVHRIQPRSTRPNATGQPVGLSSRLLDTRPLRILGFML